MELLYIVIGLVVLLLIAIGARKQLGGSPEKQKLEPPPTVEPVQEESEPEPVAEEPIEQKPETVADPEPDVAIEEVRPPVIELKKLDSALENTRQSFLGRIKGLFSGTADFTDDDMENLEEILYTSDLGPKTVQMLMESLEDKLSRKDRKDFESVRKALRDQISEIFAAVEDLTVNVEAQPAVLLIVGVNGAGKTTTIGKLARKFAEDNKKVMIAAGDTFRAAAGDQLKVWSERAQVEIFEAPEVKDPSAIAYTACEKAKSGGFDIVMIDTAGRLHTQKNLMEELKKMKRVIQKVVPDAPHETLLVLDANSGQNALVQAKEFNEALDISGVILTKLDGTAKGGVAVGVACEFKLPIKLIGVGEKIEDLRPFSSQEFIDSIL